MQSTGRLYSAGAASLTVTFIPTQTECFLTTGLSYAALHHESLIGKSTISGIVRSTCSLIWSGLHQVVMPEPKMEGWLCIAWEFEEHCQFPNCIGALDGKHIRVHKPPSLGSQFYNYKQYFSVVLLVLVDSDYRFIIVDIGAYGRTGDSRVFNSSIMGRRLRNNQLDLRPPRQLPIKILCLMSLLQMRPFN